VKIAVSSSEYVQYGCGWSAPSGWRNFDASPTLRFERLPLVGSLYTRNASRFPENVKYGDIVKGLPVPDKSCSGIYCSHVLEHLSLEDFRTAIRNTYRLIKPGGIFRLVLPDLEYHVNKYLRDSKDDSALTFLRETSLGRERRPRGVKSFFLDWMGNSQHLWMWDFKSLNTELERIGFVSIRRAYFGDSADLTFQQVENKGRWDNCLGLECYTPDNG